MTVIAFIGFGEAGGLLAAGLLKAGTEVCAAYDILIDDAKTSAALKAKAEKTGVTASPNAKEAVTGADIIISAVVSDQTLVAAKNVGPHLSAGQYYLDMNSTSPKVKREAAEVIEQSGAYYVEAAVMDLVPPHGLRVPMLLAGEKAVALSIILSEHGMDTTAIGDNIGDASAVKMVRSVFMKGFTAILLECLVAANRLGAEEPILDSLQVSFPDLDWRAVANYYAPRLVNHAKRQAAEMHEVADTLRELGVEPMTALSSAARLGWLADMELANKLDEIPETYAALLQAIRNNE
ncbi:MAG: NAD(P)-dependent oxidoreductase [Rhodospirillales bacterium]|nr:NAD(P)-dependent oxidoreductase [Rhodospirillales bacterium]